MSKYLRTLFAALLVVSLAVTGAMATEDFPKIARELIWVDGAATVTANPDTGNLVIRDGNGQIVEYPGNYNEDSNSEVVIIDPYNDNSTLGEILKNVFFVEPATEAADTFGMNRLGAYAFKFRGSDLPQAFISYNEDSHRYWIPQKLYDVEWTMETSDAEFKISYDIDADEGTIVISGLEYPNPVTSKDYKITLVGTPYLTSVGEKYYTFDYLEDAMANFPLKWSMTIHVYNDGRVVLAPGSGDIYGQNIFNKLVKPASGVNINEVSMNDSNYRVTILNDQTQDFTIAGGTVRHTYRLSLYPQDFVTYTYRSAFTEDPDSDSEPTVTLYSGETYYTDSMDMPELSETVTTAEKLVKIYSDEELSEVVDTLTVKGTSEDGVGTYEVIDPVTGDTLFGLEAELDATFPHYSGVPENTFYAYASELDFDPSKIAYDSENGEYVYSDDNVVSSSFDIDVYEKYVDEDNPNYTGSNIRGFAVRYNPKGALDEEDEFVYYPVFVSDPYVYDGVYIPEGLVLVANYGAETYVGPEGVNSGDTTTLTAGRVLSRSPLLGKVELRNYYDVVAFLGYLDAINGGGYADVDEFSAAVAVAAPALAEYIAASLDLSEEVFEGLQVDGENVIGGLYVGNYLLSYDKSVAESAIRGVKAGKVMRFTLPLVSVINDAFDDVVRTPLGRTLASGYKLQWNVFFSGDVEEEEEPVTPVIGVSGDLSATVAVGEGHDFVLSYDATLFSYTISPDADYIEEGTDEDGNEIITITPPSAGTFTATLTPYETESPDNKGTAITLTVTANLPGQLAATFNPATVPVKAGETATSMLEIINAKTGSPAVAGVSPAADWVTYEPRFINGGAFYEFKFAPAATMTAGTHTFTVTVSDDDKTTSAVVTVNVTAAGGDDPTPGPTPSTPAAPTATDLSTFQAAVQNGEEGSVTVSAPSDIASVASWKVYDNGVDVSSKVTITPSNDGNKSATITVDPSAFDAGDHTLTATYTPEGFGATESSALTLASFTVSDTPVVPIVGKNGGGGCDTGFGALALAAVSLFLLKKRS